MPTIPTHDAPVTNEEVLRHGAGSPFVGKGVALVVVVGVAEKGVGDASAALLLLLPLVVRMSVVLNVFCGLHNVSTGFIYVFSFFCFSGQKIPRSWG